MKVDFGKIAFIIVVMVLVLFGVPYMVGVVTTAPGFAFDTESQWIGFWGNYLGALVGGVVSGGVAIYVMVKIIKTTREDQKYEEIRKFTEWLISKEADFLDKVRKMVHESSVFGVDVQSGKNTREKLLAIVESCYSAKIVIFEVYLFIQTKENLPKYRNDEYDKVKNKLESLIDAIELFGREFYQAAESGEEVLEQKTGNIINLLNDCDVEIRKYVQMLLEI